MSALIAYEKSTLLGYIIRSWGAGLSLVLYRLWLQIISSHSPLLLLRWGCVFGYMVFLAGWGLLGGVDYRRARERLWLLSTSCHNRVMLDKAPTWALVQTSRPSFLRTSGDSRDPLASEARERLLLLEGSRMACYLMLLLRSLEGHALILMRIRHDEVIRGRLLHHVYVIFVQGTLRKLVRWSWPLWNYWALFLLWLDHWLACWDASCIHDCWPPALLSCLVHWSIRHYKGLPGHWGNLIVRSLLNLSNRGTIKGITWVSGNASVYQLLRILLNCALTWRIATWVGINHLWVHHVLRRLNPPYLLRIDWCVLQEVPLLFHLLLLYWEHVQHILLWVTHCSRTSADTCRCLIPRKAAIHRACMTLHRSIISWSTLHELWIILVLPLL